LYLKAKTSQPLLSQTQGDGFQEMSFLLRLGVEI